jgi:hypothetical protein
MEREGHIGSGFFFVYLYDEKKNTRRRREQASQSLINSVFFVVVLRTGLLPILELFIERKAQNVVQNVRQIFIYTRLHLHHVTLALLFSYLTSLSLSLIVEY